MQALKINQTIGVLLIAAGFALTYYHANAPEPSNSRAGVLMLFGGLAWYGVARFLMWMKKD